MPDTRLKLRAGKAELVADHVSLDYEQSFVRRIERTVEPTSRAAWSALDAIWA